MASSTAAIAAAISPTSSEQRRHDALVDIRGDPALLEALGKPEAFIIPELVKLVTLFDRPCMLAALPERCMLRTRTMHKNR
mmetsp:Transcript_106931/g.189389  ORF Transcript_106931/g.189389 Transcript_106931/m.189389 type:complete len:81 (-) Transcript_106931:30-272(-)